MCLTTLKHKKNVNEDKKEGFQVHVYINNWDGNYIVWYTIFAYE
jgi:hypothetical protein